jgi:hypothetical protein
VDHDPFGQEPRLIPVEHDPFEGSWLTKPGGFSQGTSWGNKAADIGSKMAYGAAEGIVTLPQRAIDASAQDVQHLGEEGYKRQAVGPAADATMMLAGGGMPMAERGAAGIFGGRLSKLADKSAMHQAEAMERAGASPDTLWEKLRTGRGADREWRQEIDDSMASVKDAHFDVMTENNHGQKMPGGGVVKFKNREAVPLTDILDHPELFKAYPELYDVQVKPLSKSSRSLGSQSGNTISMQDDVWKSDFKSTLLHEVQHKIQDIENFAKGDAPDNYIPRMLPQTEKEFEKMASETEKQIANDLNTNDVGVQYMKMLIRSEQDGIKRPVPDVYAKVFASILEKHPEVKERLTNIAKSEDLIHGAKVKAHTLYERTRGETESRNVQKRMSMSPEERASQSPVSTEDVPRFLQRSSVWDKKPAFIPVDYDPFEGMQ